MLVTTLLCASKTKRYAILFLLLTCFASCAGLQFSQQSLDDTENITNAAVSLISKSDEPFTTHAAEVERLRQQVMNIYAREQTRKMNQPTISMWKEVISGDGNLFALLDLWKANGRLSPAMRDESVKKIQRLLSSIYDLESHKRG